jgi:rubrerythrin
VGRGKSFKTDKEFSRKQELSNKNKELQREINKLRKALDKVNHGWCPKCTGIVDENDNKTPQELPKIKDRTCYQCGKAKLVMLKYPKPDGYWYKRECPVCGHRTRGKRLTDEVKE